MQAHVAVITLIDDRNFVITNKLFQILDDIKGFDAAMSNPRTGKLIVQYKGINYFLTVEPIFNDNDAGRVAEAQPFEKIVREHSYIWN